MEAVEERFRTALGGFNRRDVMEYIAKTAAGHRRELAELQERLAEAESARDELESRLSGVEDERGTAAAEGARVRASLEESTAALTRMRGELSQTETKLAVSRKELDRLQAQVAELEPLARRYEELKDRVATVELDAHRKAQATIDGANREATEVREATRRWLEGVLGQYQALRQGTEEILRQAETISGLRQLADRADEEVRALRERSGLE